MPVTFTPGVSEVVGTATQLSGALTEPVTATQITSLTATQITGSIVATQISTASAGAITGTLTASQGGTGLTSLTNGYVIVGNGTTTLGSAFHSNRLIAYGTAILFTATGDQALTMSLSSGVSYIPRRVTLANPIGSLATTTPTALLRTASEGGGSAVTGAFVVTGISATTTYLDQAVTLASTTVSSSQLWINVTTATAAAAAAQVWVFGDLLVN